MSSSIYIGKLGKTVGLDGSLKIYIESDFPEQFKKGAVFTTNKKARYVYNLTVLQEILLNLKILTVRMKRKNWSINNSLPRLNKHDNLVH